MQAGSTSLLLLGLVTMSLLIGCATPPLNADYGQYPMGYEEASKSAVTDKLIDPESARFRFGNPVKAYMNNGLLYGGDVGYVGYVVPLEVNAKNTLGGYTGFQTWFCLVKGSDVGHCESGSYKNHPLVHVVR